MKELLAQAYAADPIVAVLAALGAVFVAIGGLLRAGGPDARFTIDIFAYLATVASVLKALKWAAARMVGAPGEAPGGTDSLLVIGGFLAIGLVSIQGLASVFQGKERELSPLGRLLEGTSLAKRLSPRLRGLLGIQGRQVEGERLSEPPTAGTPP